MTAPVVTIERPFQAVCRCGWRSESTFIRGDAAIWADRHEASHTVERINQLRGLQRDPDEWWHI